MTSLVEGLLFGLPYWTPYTQLPGTIVAVVVVAACICVTLFLVCPRRPLLPKIIALLLCIPALYCALDFLGNYWTQ
ncbi:MAG: hypothetical protein ACLQU3_31520 [Limisphaerales bacterium]